MISFLRGGYMMRVIVKYLVEGDVESLLLFLKMQDFTLNRLR